jgi:hypothetical protein
MIRGTKWSTNAHMILNVLSVHILKTMRLSIIGQVFSFIAMCLPMLLHRLDTLPLTVLTSAVSLTLYLTLSFSFGSTYPIAKTPRAAATVVFASHWLLAIAIVGLLVSAAFLPTSLSLHSLCIAYLLSGQTVYSFAVADAIRRNDIHQINILRFIYGIANFGLTLIFCVFWAGQEAAVVASAIAFVLAPLVLLPSMRQRNFNALFPLPATAQLIRHNMHYLPAAIANLVSNLAFHAGSLALGHLGSFAAPWAITTRIAGGFATVGQQIVAPGYEMAFAQAIKDNNEAKLQQTQYKMLQLGIILGIAAIVAIVMLQFLSGTAATIGAANLPEFLFATCLFAVSMLSGTIMSKNLVMLDVQKPFLYISTFKLIAVALIVTYFRDIHVIVLIALAEGVSRLLTTIYSFRAVRFFISSNRSIYD